MKKFALSLLILICLLFSIIKVTPAVTTNVFKEGIYKSVDFGFSATNLYTVQNISPNNNIYVLIFD